MDYYRESQQLFEDGLRLTPQPPRRVRVARQIVRQELQRDAARMAVTRAVKRLTNNMKPAERG